MTFDYGVFDTETYGGLYKEFKFGYTYYNGEYNFFDNGYEMFMFMEKSGCQIWYAHNLQFDFGRMLTTTQIAKWHPFMVNGRILVMRTETTEYRDSWALMPTNLKKLGAKGEIDLKALAKKRITKKEKEYCMLDCEVLYEAIQNFSDMWNIIRKECLGLKTAHKKPKLTIGSCALDYMLESITEDYEDTSTWDSNTDSPMIKKRAAGVVWNNGRQRNKKIKPFHNRCFRESYFGGRTENFIVGVMIGDLSYWDVNSLYPWAMCQPIPNPLDIKELGVPDWTPWDIKYEGVTKIRCIQKSSYPILPVRENDKVVFRNGYIEGWYNNNEIRFAIDAGVIYDVEYIQMLKSGSTIDFKDIMENIYDERKKAKSFSKQYPDKSDYYNGIAQILKLLMNSGYGKFGQRTRDDEQYVFDNMPDFEAKMVELQDNDMHITFCDVDRMVIMAKSKVDEEAVHTMYAIPSYICSWGRIRLYTYIQKLQFAGHNIFYVDTDSIVTDAPDDFFEHSTELGEMKFEGWIKKFWAMAPKAYMEYLKVPDEKWEEIVKQKGVGKQERLRDHISPTLMEMSMTFKLALRYGGQMGDKRELGERNHDYRKQKRFVLGDINTCDEYYDCYKIGYNNFVLTRPFEFADEIQVWEEEDIIEKQKLTMHRNTPRGSMDYLYYNKQRKNVVEELGDDYDENLELEENLKKTEIDDIIHGRN